MNIISFLVGTIFGASVSIGAIIVALRLSPRMESIGRTYRAEEKDRASVGAFIEPPSFQKDAIDEIIRRNEEEGRDTPLSQIL